MASKRELEEENANLRAHVIGLEEELSNYRSIVVDEPVTSKEWILEEVCRAAEMAVNKQRVAVSRPSNRLSPLPVIPRTNKMYTVEEVTKHFRATVGNAISRAMWDRLIGVL